jgi:HEAT repeat protein
MDRAAWERLIASIRSLGDDPDRACEAWKALREITDSSRIPELEHFLEDDDFFMREAAAGALINPRGIDRLLHLLQGIERVMQEGHDCAGLEFEITDLVKSKKAEVTPRLLEMLQSNSSVTRAHAAELLRFVSEAVSPQPLFEALKDADPFVRSSAVLTLPNFKGHPEVLESMLPLLNDADEDVRCYAALALAYFGDPRAVPALRRATSDPSERVCHYADYSLGFFGGGERVLDWMACLFDEPPQPCLWDWPASKYRR